jgi:hypothetical protein
MSVLNDPAAFRKALFGLVASKAYTPIQVETKVLFNITGGAVIVTGIVGRVTTAITVAGTTKLQSNPSGTGATVDLVAATDLGTTDTPVNSLLSFDGIRASSIQYVGTSGGGAVPMLQRPIVIDAGAIEQVTATGADGGITWQVTWVPLDDGAVLAAA